MKNFILVLFSFVAVACSSLRQVTPTEKIVTETRIETVFQTDTVFLEVPQIVERIVTKDTASVLENEFAKSAASVTTLSVGVTCFIEPQATHRREKRTSIKFFIG